MATYAEAIIGGFANLFNWHLLNGTRPTWGKHGAKAKAWSNKEFGGALRQIFDERSVRYWRTGSVVPRILDHIESALFGDDPQDQLATWREDLRRAYVKAKSPTDREFKVEWTSEGPQAFGNGTFLSTLELAALLDRWFQAYDELLPREQAKRGVDKTAAQEATNVLAVIRAIQETFGRVITQSDVRELDTELGRKADLFYRFMDAADYDAMHSEWLVDKGRQSPDNISGQHPANAPQNEAEVISSKGEGASPRQRDLIRAKRNERLVADLKEREGINDCFVMQIEDHTDKGYIVTVTFEPEQICAAEVSSLVRATLDEMVPHVPFWGELMTESEETISFGYAYIDKYNKVFKR